MVTAGINTDTVELPGIGVASVTNLSYSGDANGGTLTIDEGTTSQSLKFAGNFTTASFALSAGPQALSTSPPGLLIKVTAVPTPPTVALYSSGTITAAIINTTTPTVFGNAAAGATLTLQANGVAEGSPTLSTTIQSSAAYYHTILPSSLGLGAQQVTAVATNAAGSTQSTTPLSLFVLPAPVNGITTANNVGSLDLSTVLGQGYSMQFVSGIEAIQLINGTLSVGPDTNEALIQRLYDGLLGRPGDTNGLGNYDQALSAGTNPADVATNFLTSPEYQGDHGALASMTDTQFVTNLYSGFLGRAPDSAGLNAYTAALGAGASRGQIAVTFAQSAEAKTYLASTTADVWAPNAKGALVNDIYNIGLDRNVEPGGLQSWTQAIQSGLTTAGLVNQIAASTEFQADHAGQSATAYVTSLYQDGLGRAPDPGGLQNWVSAMQGVQRRRQSCLASPVRRKPSCICHRSSNLSHRLLDPSYRRRTHYATRGQAGLPLRPSETRGETSGSSYVRRPPERTVDGSTAARR